MDQEKLNKVLGLDEHKPQNKYVCFLPFRGEFGWYIQTFVKRIHGYNHHNKIVCTKRGHECLFPSAQRFYYDWQDADDTIKAGILSNTDEDLLKKNIIDYMQTEDIFFLSPSETSWAEKESLANITFIPQSLHNLGLKTDVVIAPRNRMIDAHRNATQTSWQTLVNELVQQNISVGVCGAANSSFNLVNIKHKAYEHIDVDSDVELINNAKLIIVHESGMQYLSFLCERPTFCIDHYLGASSDLHRKLSVPFKLLKNILNDPKKLTNEIMAIIKV
jgi:hypothetical protein